MKNRRFTIVAFLLVAVVAMSVGFAAITRQVTISGTTYLNVDSSFAIKFDSFTLNESSTTAPNKTTDYIPTVSYIDGDAKTQAQVNIGTIGAGSTTNNAFTAAGQVVVFDIAVINPSTQYKAKLQAPNISFGSNATNDYINVELIKKDGTAADIENTLLDIYDTTVGDTDDTVSLTLKVTLKQMPTDATEIAFTVLLKADAQTKDSSGS